MFHTVGEIRLKLHTYLFSFFLGFNLISPTSETKGIKSLIVGGLGSISFSQYISTRHQIKICKVYLYFEWRYTVRRSMFPRLTANKDNFYISLCTCFSEIVFIPVRRHTHRLQNRVHPQILSLINCGHGSGVHGWEQ